VKEKGGGKNRPRARPQGSLPKESGRKHELRSGIKRNKRCCRISPIPGSFSRHIEKSGGEIIMNNRDSGTSVEPGSSAGETTRRYGGLEVGVSGRLSGGWGIESREKDPVTLKLVSTMHLEGGEKQLR